MLCTEVENEVCSAKWEVRMKVAIGNKFKMAVTAVLNFVFGSYYFQHRSKFLHHIWYSDGKSAA